MRRSNQKTFHVHLAEVTNYYHSRLRIHTSHADPSMEAHTWRFLWVIFVAEELQLINAAFMYALIQMSTNLQSNI